MSGHSKWATIKHKKGAVDKARGKLFAKLARQLEVAAAVVAAIQTPTRRCAQRCRRPKAAQMTNDAIDRAIKRGTGDDDGGTYESITYEGYAPGGVALMIDVLTDNRNRTGLRHPRCVHQAWRFAGRAWFGGMAVQPARDPARRRLAGEDEVMLAALDAGATDVVDDGGTWRVTTEPSAVFDVRQALEDVGLQVESADTPMVSDNLVPITDVAEARRVLRVLDAIEDNDDVQDVYSNFDIADDLINAAMERAMSERVLERPNRRHGAPVSERVWGES